MNIRIGTHARLTHIPRHSAPAQTDLPVVRRMPSQQRVEVVRARQEVELVADPARQLWLIDSIARERAQRRAGIVTAADAAAAREGANVAGSAPGSAVTQARALCRS
jgi:hypothetical protein